MINGYDIPKLYLADFTTIRSPLNSAGLRYAVIDGKQRMQAIFSFLRNEIPLSPEFKLEDDESIPLRGLYFKDISEKFAVLAERVEEFPLPVVHVVTDDSNRIRELFLRLNKGLVLTGPEKRSAMLGSVPVAISNLVSHEFFEFSTSYQSKRGQDLNTAAKFFSFEANNAITETKRNTLDSLTMFLADDEEIVDTIRIKCYQNLDKMAAVFGRKDPLLKSAGSIPTYYWFIRQIHVDQIRYCRSYLSWFNSQINPSNTSKMLIPNLEVSIEDINTYKNALRSINDKWSHQVRFDLLRTYFDKWISYS